MTLNRLGSQSSSTGVWRMQSSIDRQLTSIDTVAMSADNGTFISPSVEEFFGLDSVCSSPGYSREESFVSSDSAIDCDSDGDLAVSPLPLVRGRSSLDLSDDHMNNAVFCFIKSYVSASGSSTVAIDNKIEQAMDLVKSHLMFAVREEVEVLKERIAELLDRIAFLETENSLLRAAASPETLAELSHLENTYRISSSTSSSNTGGVSSTSSLGPTNNGNL